MDGSPAIADLADLGPHALWIESLLTSERQRREQAEARALLLEADRDALVRQCGRLTVLCEELQAEVRRGLLDGRK